MPGASLNASSASTSPGGAVTGSVWIRSSGASIASAARCCSMNDEVTRTRMDTADESDGGGGEGPPLLYTLDTLFAAP